MRESQFIRIPSQGSIYSVARLGSKLIVGSGNHGKVYSYAPKGSLEELSLDLPNDIEIVAVDAFQDICPVLAVTFVHKGVGDADTDKPKAGLNIYYTIQPDVPAHNTDMSEGFSSKPFSPSHVKATSANRMKADLIDSNLLDLIAQNSKTFRLDYIPYDLFHVPIKRNEDSYGHVFLLSGSDRRIHLFQAGDDKNTFEEYPVDRYFPEISKEFDSIVTRIQIESLNERTRISVCGTENGTLHVWIISSSFTYKSSSSSRAGSNQRKNSLEKGDEIEEPRDSEVVEKIEHHFDGMITSIQFYTDGFHCNFVVASACSPTYIYTNTVEDRFASGVPLKFSSRWDSVQSVCVADIDYDGRAEIILGTFGCTMLVYKYMDDVMSGWVIVAHKKFCSAIFSIDFIDNALHVVTASGIHVMEYSTSAYFHKYNSSTGNAISGSIPEEITSPD